MDGTTANGQERICFGLANGGEAGIYAFWGGKEGVENNIHLYELNRLQKMSEAELEQAEPLRVNYASAEETVAAAGDMHIYSGYSDGLYMADQNRMWQIDMADGSLEALFQWENIHIKAEYLQAVRRQEDGGFLLYIFDTLEQENYWVALEPMPASQIPEKKELVLGVAGTSWYNDSLASKIDQVVLSYNRIHPECHITVKEYEEKAVSDFQLELLKGEGPDILLERQSFFDMDDLSAKGAVKDLMPYLAAAEDVSAEDILPGILDLITKNGKIPRIPLSFAVDVMILPEDMPQEVLTPRQMAEYMAQGEDTRIDYLVSPEAFLLQVLSGAEMDHYVDENGRSSSFAGEEFVSLLESLDKLGDLRRISKRGERAELFHAGQLLAVTEEVNCLDDYFCIRSAFSGKGRIAGFPNSAGELRYPAKLYDWMGINSASEHKEEAWSFIAFCLSYTNRSDNVADRFVVLKDKFEQQIRYDKSGSYFIWRNDYDENFEGWQEIASVTPEETGLLREITEHLYFYENKSLFQIINEEAAAFFDGNISSQEAAERIQNRANLLLGE